VPGLKMAKLANMANMAKMLDVDKSAEAMLYRMQTCRDWTVEGVRDWEKALSCLFPGTNGTLCALLIGKDLVRGSAMEVIAMIDPVTASNDRVRETERWGYTGDLLEDSVPVDEPQGAGRGLLWGVLLLVAIVVVIALFANPL
jgi:hypothetical protein